MIEVKAAILDGNASFVENDNLTVEQLNEIYIEANKTNWKPTSERNHIYVMNKYVLDYIGRFKIKSVNNLIIQRELIDPLINEGFKEGTLLNIYRRVNAIFSFAIKNEFLDRKRFTSPNLKKASESIKRNALTISEVTEILEIARTKYKITHYTCLSLLFLTGMRVGELRALQWGTDIDFENNLIHINKTKDRFGSRSPKTKNSYRKFPMNESIKSILLDYRKWYEEIMETCKFRNPEGHVIITYAGEPIGERYLKRIIDLICERENITYFTPHFLRHTFVTIQLSNNIPVSTVAALVGDTPETIYKVYAHSFAKDEVHASNLMDEIINLSSFEKTKEIKK
ncbi:tyrosine-type recombinase/integrase [Lysinibacillus pakistanensis]|uniref:Tyrosine-type recombinase/integrase n=1 Tax=Lysinibacillus pakistanensis TaxID=759811 RepID=A0AAX3X155_9BACI|nr:tyrosine-type recombinase/integrase [Lysinibacillus pakistanensis]MDM5233417.1 tyrosine-type recombinase/integrase [Lysinibacillus pakistanensis]WHY48890.1 tyrosine-type recombinase/integrase [Lysinibacillus pakistanensis]WHY53901.1 tyrosine-type recombinase/integrase [Lysinibacillus pakistanensis]